MSIKGTFHGGGNQQKGKGKRERKLGGKHNQSVLKLTKYYLEKVDAGQRLRV
jgi:hypothetical protein